MKILYLSRDYTTHDHRFLSSLAENEHEVYFLRLENKSKSMEGTTLPKDIRELDWAGAKAKIRLIDGLGLLISLRKIIKQIEPDIIHAGPIQSAGLLAALSGFHTIVVMSWAYDLLFDANKNLLTRWATRKTLKKADVMIVDSESIVDIAIEYGFPKKKIICFPWGIDLDKFSPADGKALRKELSWEKNDFVLLHNRAWEKIYGVEIFAKAFVLATKQHPELKLMLLNHGSLAGQLKSIFEQGGVSEKVKMLGKINQDELPKFYHAADLYISASRSDGSSVSLMEALGCGLPVLISDIPGNKEWITSGNEGWLFEDGKTKALSNGISEAVLQRKKLKKMGIKARQLAEERADWPKNFEKLLEAYELAKGQYV